MLANEVQSGIFEATEHIVVTAGGGQNDLCAPFQRLAQHQIGSGVAGVQRDDHMHGRAEIVSGHVGTGEGKALHAEVAGDAIALGHDLRLHIHARHPHLAATDHGEIVIDGKGEIALAAAQIANVQNSLCGQGRFGIPNELEEAVDLTEFCLLFVIYAAVRVTHAQFPQEGLIALENVAFDLIVAENGQLFGRRNRSLQRTAHGRSTHKGLLAALGAAKLAVAHRGHDIDLIAGQSKRQQSLLGGIGAQIFMRRLHGLALARYGVGHVGHPQGLHLQDGLPSHAAAGNGVTGHGFIVRFGKNDAIQHLGAGGGEHQRHHVGRNSLLVCVCNIGTHCVLLSSQNTIRDNYFLFFWEGLPSASSLSSTGSG